jgi:hypothetical protein
MEHLERAVRVQDSQERVRPFRADVDVHEAQGHERALFAKGHRERARALLVDVVAVEVQLVSVALFSRAAASARAP